jgi:hypothetical protein
VSKISRMVRRDLRAIPHPHMWPDWDHYYDILRRVVCRGAFWFLCEWVRLSAFWISWYHIILNVRREWTSKWSTFHFKFCMMKLFHSERFTYSGTGNCFCERLRLLLWYFSLVIESYHLEVS